MKARVRHSISIGGAVFGGLILGWIVSGMTHRSPANPDDSAGPKAPSHPPSLRGAMPSDVGQLIRAVHAAGPPAAQMLAALELAGRIAPEDFPKYLENERFLPDHQAKSVFIRAILRRWIGTDPQAALGWCLGHNRELVGDAMKEWASRDLQNAEKFASRLPSPHRDNALGGVFSVMAARDPDAAFAFLEQVRTSRSHQFLFEGLRELAKADPARLLEAAEAYPQGLRQLARERAAVAWAKLDFDAALAWTLDQPDRRNWIGGILSQTDDPARVLSIVSGLSEEEHGHVTLQVAYDWGRKNPLGLLAALKSATNLSTNTLDSLLRNLEGPLARQNPAGAADQLMAAFPEKIAAWAPSLASALAYRDIESAKRFAESLVDENLRRQATESIRRLEGTPTGTPFERTVTMLKDNHYVESRQLLALSSAERRQLWEQLDSRTDDPPSPGRSNLENAMFGSFPADMAAELAARPPDEPKTVESASQLAARWVNEEPDAASQWVTMLPAGKARESAVENLVRQWFRDDPAAADAWVKALPKDFEPDAVAKAMASPSGGR